MSHRPSPPPPTLVIQIHTHAHSPPLRPPADISFDLRRFPNPPKAIRDRYDGRSRRLREHLLREPAFGERLEGAVAEIVKAVEDGKGRSIEVGDLQDEDEEVREEHGEKEIDGDENDDDDDDDDDDEVDVASEENDDEDRHKSTSTGSEGISISTSTSTSTSMPGASSVGPSLTNEALTSVSANALGAIEGAEQDQTQEPETFSRHHVQDPSASSLPPPPTMIRILRISCFCARGRHRSVAFAEELARWRRPDGSSWPLGWDVRVVHRDVDGRSRKGGKGGSGRGGGARQGHRRRGDRWRRGVEDGDGFES